MNELGITLWIGLGIIIVYLVASIFYMLQLNKMLTYYGRVIEFYQKTCDRLEDKRKYNRPRG